MSRKVTIKLNAPLRGYAAGTELRIEVDKDGTPLERYWRDRFKDAKTDKCVELADKKSFVKPNNTDKSSTEGGKK